MVHDKVHEVVSRIRFEDDDEDDDEDDTAFIRNANGSSLFCLLTSRPNIRD